MPPIYFGTVDLNAQIHCQGLGFTYQYYLYACAGSKSEAERLMETWATAKGCDVKKVTAQVSHEQDVRKFTFPEQIINLPSDVLQVEYDRREYPANYRDPARQVCLEG